MSIHTLFFYQAEDGIRAAQGCRGLGDVYKGQEIVNAEVYLRLDKDQTKGNKVSEIKVDLSGKPLFARRQSKTFEEATDSAVDALKKQITKHKQKKRGI